MINQITSSGPKPIATTQSGRVNNASGSTSSTSNNQAAHTASFSPESSLRIVNDNVIDSIDKELAKTNASSVRDLDAENFTPESVAKGILSFVQDAISRAKARGQSTEKLLGQAKIGIDRGFEQATNILTSLNALSGQIAEGVQKTYNLIQHGIQKLEAAQIDGSTVNFDNEISHFSQQSQTKSQSFELNIKTHDGDNIQLNISQGDSQKTYNANISKGDTGTAIRHTETRSSNNIQYTVSGNLDEAEIAAIEELLSEVKALSDSFFDGDVNAAFEAGLSLGFNTQEIASFALELNESQSQRASRAYREVNSFGTEEYRVSPTKLENLLKPAHDFMSTLKSDLEKANNSELFDNQSSKSVEGLLNYFSRGNPNNQRQIESLESLTGSTFENMTQQLISSIS
ncbi:MAG: DUF5610 domain-containing protein [Gammaproteobacteria bacterium]|nr:DUF5610 domain-containing protein [Gammaproteobacteria bacterium]